VTGRVLLVGAGPGAPDLLTLRGAEALRGADAVLYDELASEEELLGLAPPHALRINVGKRGHDAPTRSQEEITALLLRLAREGRTVVRLKGGDPFVFGRGGEEASACAEAGIPFEVVPGISSLVGGLAYAGIPLTDRRFAASFAVVTGHKDPTKPAQETRWDLLAHAADTLVILMGMRNLETLAARLVEAGRDPETPAAVVMDATLPTQRTVEAPLRQIARRAREEALGAPALVVIGDVVRLRRTLAWLERRPLHGLRVLLTRPAAQSAEWASALRAAGAVPVLVPMIRTEASPDTAAQDAALGALSGYDALVFTSANGVRHFAERAAERGLRPPAGMRVFCVGESTAAAAREAGLPADLVPARTDAAGLADAIREAFPPAGRRFLWPRAEAARDALPRGLEAAGARVDGVPFYRTVPAAVDAADLRRRLVAGELGALAFASPSAVRRFAELLDAPSRAAASRCIVAALGPATAEALREAGLPVSVTAGRARAADLAAALAARVAEQRAGGPE